MQESPTPDAKHQLLEEQLAFQQHQLEELNQALVSQRAELDKVRQDLAGLISAVRNLMESSGTDLPHERPPHY